MRTILLLIFLQVQAFGQHIGFEYNSDSTTRRVFVINSTFGEDGLRICFDELCEGMAFRDHYDDVLFWSYMYQGANDKLYGGSYSLIVGKVVIDVNTWLRKNQYLLIPGERRVKRYERLPLGSRR